MVNEYIKNSKSLVPIHGNFLFNLFCSVIASPSCQIAPPHTPQTNVWFSIGSGAWWCTVYLFGVNMIENLLQMWVDSLDDSQRLWPTPSLRSAICSVEARQLRSLRCLEGFMSSESSEVCWSTLRKCGFSNFQSPKNMASLCFIRIWPPKKYRGSIGKCQDRGVWTPQEMGLWCNSWGFHCSVSFSHL